MSAEVREARPVRGLVRRPSTAAVFDRRLWPVDDDLAPWVDHVWSVEWDRGDALPTTSSVISFPAMHLTVEWGEDRVRHGHRLPAVLVHGVVSEVFTVQLARAGGVVGARFHPDGFAFWSGLDVSPLTDRVVQAADVLPDIDPGLQAAVLAESGMEGRVERFVAALRTARPAATPPRRGRLADLVRRVADDRSLTRIAQLESLTGWTTRTLQRRFRHDLGVGPKWVLTRFRLQQAAYALEQDPGTDLAGLAVELGWYDQAHLTNDFRRLLGETPADYAARAHAGAP